MTSPALAPPLRQTVVGESRPVRMALEPDVIAKLVATRAGIAARSALVWGEHCSECVMPSCYASCAFYTPRADLKCRRFVDGVESARAEPGGAPIGLRVAFRKWGKLEASGRLAALPARRAAQIAGADAALSGLLGALPAPHWLKDGAANLLNRAKTRLAERGGARAFDAFLIEVFSDGSRDALFTLSVKPATPNGRYFQRHVRFAPGYNRMAIAATDIAAAVDLAAPLLVQLEPVGAPDGASFLFATLDFVVFDEAAARTLEAPLPAAKVKCVVWDLDNTLWRGVLIEDGLEALRLDETAAAAIRALDARGVLHSIASKNDPEPALAALEHFGLREYFLAPQIGWGPKSASIDEIARRLNLHRNSFLFVDDSAFERGEVAAACPEMRVVAESAISDLTRLPELDHAVTDEARNRRAMYRVEESRAAAERLGNGDFLAFLRGCAITLTIGELGQANIARVFELSQRTNQLNYAGRAAARGDIEALLAGGAPGKAGFVLSCADRFGDYGVIGFAVVDVERFHVENFFMSCRVQHKKVDHAFFAWAIEQARASGLDRVSTVFRSSGRNQSARTVLSDMRFEPTSEPDTLVSPLLDDLPERDIVAVVDRTRFSRAPAPLAMAS